MANKARGEYTIKGDETYTLVFTTNAIAQAEGQLGYGVGAVIGNYMSGRFSINETRILLWGALLKHHSPLSVEDAGEILDEVLVKGKDLGGVFETLMDAVNHALPFKNENEGDNPNAQKMVLETGTRKRQKNSGQASSPQLTEVE